MRLISAGSQVRILSGPLLRIRAGGEGKRGRAAAIESKQIDRFSEFEVQTRRAGSPGPSGTGSALGASCEAFKTHPLGAFLTLGWFFDIYIQKVK